MDHDQSPLLGESVTQQRDRSRHGRAILLMQTVLEYGPFILVAALLAATSISDEIPRLSNIFPSSRVGLYVCLAFIALLAFVLRLIDRTSDLAEKVRFNTEIQERFISAASRTTSEAPLGEAFHSVGELLGRCEKIRVFAITSKFISQHMQPREFSVEELQLLVSGASGGTDTLLDTEVLLSVLYTWAGRVKAGAISSLAVRQFNFYPTEWFAIFDDRLMITGYYIYDQEAIGKTRTSPVAYVTRNDEDGRKLIASKAEVFDALFAGANADFGDGKYEGIYKVMDGVVKRQKPGNDDWAPLNPISQSALPLKAE